MTQREEFEAWWDANPELPVNRESMFLAWQAAQLSAMVIFEQMLAAQAVQPAQVPDYREIADCVLAGLEDRKGVLNLNVDTDIEEEIRQEVADNIRMMLSAEPSTKDGQP